MVSHNLLKYTNNILAEFFRYLLSYMKPDTVIIISSITNIIDLFILT